MRIIPAPPDWHKQLSPAGERIADQMWWTLHAFAYTLIAGVVGAVITVAILALK